MTLYRLHHDCEPGCLARIALFKSCASRGATHTTHAAGGQLGVVHIDKDSASHREAAEKTDDYMCSLMN
jgi:hypothetical protein